MTGRLVTPLPALLAGILAAAPLAASNHQVATVEQNDVGANQSALDAEAELRASQTKLLWDGHDAARGTIARETCEEDARCRESIFYLVLRGQKDLKGSAARCAAGRATCDPYKLSRDQIASFQDAVNKPQNAEPKSPPSAWWNGWPAWLIGGLLLIAAAAFFYLRRIGVLARFGFGSDGRDRANARRRQVAAREEGVAEAELEKEGGGGDLAAVGIAPPPPVDMDAIAKRVAEEVVPRVESKVDQLSASVTRAIAAAAASRPDVNVVRQPDVRTLRSDDAPERDPAGTSQIMVALNRLQVDVGRLKEAGPSAASTLQSHQSQLQALAAALAGQVAELDLVLTKAREAPVLDPVEEAVEQSPAEDVPELPEESGQAPAPSDIAVVEHAIETFFDDLCRHASADVVDRLRRRCAGPVEGADARDRIVAIFHAAHDLALTKGLTFATTPFRTLLDTGGLGSGLSIFVPSIDYGADTGSVDARNTFGNTQTVERVLSPGLNSTGDGAPLVKPVIDWSPH